MLLKETDRQEVVSLYNSDPAFKALIGQLVRLQRTNPEKVTTLQAVISNYLEEHRFARSTVGWILDSVRSFLVRSFLPESFTVARVQAPLAILPPPPPPAPAMLKKSAVERKKERQELAAQEAAAKKLELARTVLSLVKSQEQVEDIMTKGDKTTIQVKDNELDIMLPREQLSEQMVLDIMIERFHERLGQQKQNLRANAIAEVVATLEKNKMIPVLSREDKPAELLLQEAVNKLKEYSKTLPEIKREASKEVVSEKLDASTQAIADQAKAIKAKHGEKRQDVIVEATVSRPDALGFNELADVLKEIQARVELSKNDPSNFTKANLTKVKEQMALGLKKVSEEGKEIERKLKITKPSIITSLCKKELGRMREAVAKVGSILIENKPTPMAMVPIDTPAAPTAQIAVEEQPAAPAVSTATAEPAVVAKVVVAQQVQEGFFARLFGRGNSTPTAGVSK